MCAYMSMGGIGSDTGSMFIRWQRFVQISIERLIQNHDSFIPAVILLFKGYWIDACYRRIKLTTVQPRISGHYGGQAGDLFGCSSHPRTCEYVQLNGCLLL